MKSPYANAVLTLFSGVLVAVLVYLYYSSELRDRVENKLFDVRTRLAPSLTSTDSVAVITISQRAIDQLEATTPMPAPAVGAEPKPRDLTYDTLIRIVEAALKSKAKKVAVLIPPQIFPYNHDGMKRLVSMGLGDGRLVLGTFDQTRSAPSEVFRGAEAFAVRADITREFRRDIIRQLVIQEKGEIPYLTAQILEEEEPDAVASLPVDEDGKSVVELNYVSPARIRQIEATDLLKDPGLADGLKGRVVLIGYTAFRPWTFSNRESTYVNTPWQAEGDDVGEGMPVVTVTAVGIVNLLEHSWLRPAALTVNVAQTLLVAIIALATWQFSIGFASFLFIGGWSVILLVHALIFSTLHVHVPLTDAFLASSIATMLGALYRLRVEGKLRAEQQARFEADKELARIQDRFLSRFASELKTINDKIQGVLAGLGPMTPSVAGIQQAFVRALGSSEELGDYLAGIQQFASLREAELTQPTLAEIDLMPVIEAVLRQFDSRKLETRLSFQVVAPAPCPAYADRTLLTQILYNLVSNAVKYSPEGSTIKIFAETGDATVTLRVKDEGPGIAPEFQERIFEKFYRVKDDYVYKHKGHGLGLYLSRFFAEQIGAAISVESTLGQGAEFSLTLRRQGRS